MTAITLTHIGGPTALIDFGGIRLLTDPTFDAGGGAYPMGPVTLHKTTGPAIAASEIGPVDCVLLSHDHHADNLDHAGRTMLASAGTVLTTQDGATRLGGNAVGLTPWQSIDLAANSRTLRVVATPARHGPPEADRGPVLGFVLFFADEPDQVVYFSGDTVWYEGVAEVARRFRVKAALLNLGAARVREVGPFHVTMTAAEAVETAHAFSTARIVPLHFEGWAHFSEGRDVIAQAFAAAGMTGRLLWPELGRPITLTP